VSKNAQEVLKRDLDQYAGCVAGAALVSEVEEMLCAAGFIDISVAVKKESREFIKDWFPDSGVEDYVASARIEARKPSACSGQEGDAALDAGTEATCRE